jgi:hypothetical protein
MDNHKKLNRASLFRHIIDTFGDEGQKWCDIQATKMKLNEVDNIVQWNSELQESVARKWITEEVASLSTIGTHTTVKCYMTTLVEHIGIREFMKRYSRLMTTLYRRFSIVINLMAIEAASSGEQSLDAYLVDLKSQTFLKKAMLPEKWGNTLASTRISDIYSSNADVLEPLNSSIRGWEKLMPATAWDQALNSLRSKYATAIKVHLTSHLITRIKKVIRANAKDAENALMHFFLSPKRKDGLNIEDVELVTHWKSLLGVGFRAKLPKIESKRLTPMLFRAHMLCCSATDLLEDVKGFSPLPLADLSRSFFMIDRRIYTSLVKKHPDWPHTFEEAFSSDRNAIKAKKLAIRKKLRGRLKAEKRRNVRDKLKRICKRGVGCIPKQATITSISTDGVAICVCMVLPYVKVTGDHIPIDESEARKTQCLREERGSVILSNDPGCKLIYCMGVSRDGTSNEGAVDLWSLSDKDLYEQSGRKKYAELEKEWMQNKPEVTAALEAMGEGALKCCDGERWQTCLKAQASAWKDLEKEYVTEDRRLPLLMNGAQSAHIR